MTFLLCFILTLSFLSFSEVIAMAPQEMVVDTNGSDYPQEANVAGIGQ